MLILIDGVDECLSVKKDTHFSVAVPEHGLNSLLGHRLGPAPVDDSDALHAAENRHGALRSGQGTKLSHRLF